MSNQESNQDRVYNPVTGSVAVIPQGWQEGRADALVERISRPDGPPDEPVYGVAVTGPRGRLVPCRWREGQWKTIRLRRRGAISYFKSLQSACDAIEQSLLQPPPK